MINFMYTLFQRIIICQSVPSCSFKVVTLYSKSTARRQKMRKITWNLKRSLRISWYLSSVKTTWMFSVSAGVVAYSIGALFVIFF